MVLNWLEPSFKLYTFGLRSQVYLQHRRRKAVFYSYIKSENKSFELNYLTQSSKLGTQNYCQSLVQVTVNFAELRGQSEL